LHSIAWSRGLCSADSCCSRFTARLSGVKQELTGRGRDAPVWDIAGFPHQEAFALGSWIVLGFLVIALLAYLWERRRAVYLLGAAGALATICPLLAGRWETQIATASAWRWIASLFLVLASLPLWFRTRLRSTNFSLSSLGDERGDKRQTEFCRTLARQTRVLVLATTLAPLLALTVYPALRAIYYMPVHGPSSGIFYFLDEDFSYSVPLVIAALVLIGYAVRERLPTYALSAGLLFNLIATMIYLLSVAAVHGSMNRVVLAHTIQLNAMTSALYALVWLGTRKRWRRQLT
jgi:MFS family permease